VKSTHAAIKNSFDARLCTGDPNQRNSQPQINADSADEKQIEVSIGAHLRKSVASFSAFDYNLGPCALTDETF
jgi:hypothetical protein